MIFILKCSIILLTILNITNFINIIKTKNKKNVIQDIILSVITFVISYYYLENLINLDVGKNTTIKKVHACMESGILSSNIKDLDICTIAPTIENCHSVNENVSISSIKRVYEWLKDTLIRFNK